MADIELTEQISIFFFRALETDILKSSIGRKNPGRELTCGGKGVNLAGIYVYFPFRCSEKSCKHLFLIIRRLVAYYETGLASRTPKNQQAGNQTDNFY
jgi:hypothetical protein